MLFTCAIVLCLILQSVICHGGGLCPCENYDHIEKECELLEKRLTCKPKPQILGMGGIPGYPWEWPYLIALQIPYQSKGPDCYKHYCAGSLIASNLVLTAAHCVSKLMGKDVKARFDIPYIYAAQAPHCRFLGNGRGKYGLRSYVTHAYKHSDFDTFNLVPNGDLAILVLSESLPGPYVKLAEPALQLSQNQLITIAGYGNTDPEETNNPQLYNMRRFRVAELQYTPGDFCKLLLDSYYEGEGDRLNPQTMICGSNHDADSCNGDSGGPAVLKGDKPEEDVLVGIMSWGPPKQCTKYDDNQAPAVFVSVSAYREWIDDIMAQHT